VVEDKRLLCRWSNATGLRWASGPGAMSFDPDEDVGFRLEQPPEKMFFLQMKRCHASFPRCDVPVGDVAQCLSKRFPPREDRDHDMAAPYPVPPECEAVKGCVWGLEETPTPAP
jgi:hypothetical protein